MAWLLVMPEEKAEAVIMRIADIFMSFSINCADPGAGCCSGTVCLVCNLCHRCARLDPVCQTDLCQCAFRIRERICRICKGNWYLHFKIVTKYVLPNSFAPDPDRNHIPDGECHPFRIILKLPWHGCTAAGSKLGKYALRCAVHYCAFPRSWIWLPPGLALDHGVKY